MGIQNCVLRPQNYFVTLEMIEGYSFVSCGFWCKFFFNFLFFKFLIVLNYFKCLFLIIITFNLNILFYFLFHF